MDGVPARRSETQAIQAALRTTTETLAAALAQRTTPTPRWSDYEWRIAKAAAAIHGVAPALCGISSWQSPSDWQQFLQDQKQHTLTRHARIEELLALLHKRSSAAGIALLPMKGPALYSLGLYAPGERPMADVDLLVAETDAERAGTLIEQLGFHRQFTLWRHQVFAAEGSVASLGEHASNPMKIELHTGIAEALPLRLTRITPLIFPAQPQPGLNPYPSKAALMLHLLLHAAGAIVTRALRLLQLNDLALLSATLSDAEWDRVLAPADGTQCWWALPPLTLAARYYRGAVPTAVLERLAVQCPLFLRRLARGWTLSDISLSRLWVDAFPGIEWSRSAPEVLRYAASRVRPTQAALLQRRQLLQCQPADRQTQWQHLSQGQRMLRWMVSRPARDETLSVVRAALTSTP